MKIVSWNVNGIRAAIRKGLMDYLAKEDADIVCLQETKASRGDLDVDLGAMQGYRSFWHAGERRGYAGTLVLSKEKPLSWKNKFENKTFHEDGRVIEMEFPDFTLFNVYFPNGGTRADGTEMLSYKLRFYEDFITYANTTGDSGKSVIICGDFNIAHEEIDIARPKSNKNNIGFTRPERDKFSWMLSEGYVDLFRQFYPEKIEYTWWSMRTAARERNVGWRLDYFVSSKDIVSKIASIKNKTEITGSDHCPVVIELR